MNFVAFAIFFFWSFGLNLSQATKSSISEVTSERDILIEEDNHVTSLPRHSRTFRDDNNDDKMIKILYMEEGYDIDMNITFSFYPGGATLMKVVGSKEGEQALWVEGSNYPKLYLIEDRASCFNLRNEDEVVAIELRIILPIAPFVYQDNFYSTDVHAEQFKDGCLVLLQEKDTESGPGEVIRRDSMRETQGERNTSGNRGGQYEEENSDDGDSFKPSSATVFQDANDTNLESLPFDVNLPHLFPGADETDLQNLLSSTNYSETRDNLQVRTSYDPRTITLANFKLLGASIVLNTVSVASANIASPIVVNQRPPAPVAASPADTSIFATFPLVQLRGLDGNFFLGLSAILLGVYIGAVFLGGFGETFTDRISSNHNIDYFDGPNRLEERVSSKLTFLNRMVNNAIRTFTHKSRSWNHQTSF